MYRIPRAELVNNNQLVGTHELMASKYRVLNLYGVVAGLPAREDAWNASYIADQMIAMSLEDPDTPIVLFIDTPGGLVRDGLRLIDTMKTVEAPVWTVGSTSYSFGAMLLSSGEQGNRYVLPNSSTMLHLPSGGAYGDEKTIEIQAKEMKKIKDNLVDILRANGVKKTAKSILKDIDRELYFNAEETVAYGIADKVFTTDVFKQIRKHSEEADSE